MFGGVRKERDHSRFVGTAPAWGRQTVSGSDPWTPSKNFQLLEPHCSSSGSFHLRYAGELSKVSPFHQRSTLRRVVRRRVSCARMRWRFFTIVQLEEMSENERWLEKQNNSNAKARAWSHKWGHWASGWRSRRKRGEL